MPIGRGIDLSDAEGCLRPGEFFIRAIQMNNQLTVRTSLENERQIDHTRAV